MEAAVYPEETCPKTGQYRGCGGTDTTPLREVASAAMVFGQRRKLYESESGRAYAYDEKL